MGSEKTITVNLVNRNYPPHSGITGESAAELVSFLVEKKIAVNVIHVQADYGKAIERQKPVGKIFGIKTFYNGKNKILRLFANIYEGISLIFKSKSLNPDLTICMTDPPLLDIWAALLLKKKWILWSMDLYPEALSAAGLLSSNSLLYKTIDRILTKGKPCHIISLGTYQSEFLKKKYGDNLKFTELPCGIYDDPNEKTTRPIWASDPSKVYIGYCGNLGEAHSIEFLFSVINRLNPECHVLILAVYGSKSEELLNYASGKPGVKIVSFVKRVELKYIDIHLSTLRKEWINVCVPSKTVSSVCAGSAFLYHGSKNSDNWALLQDAGWIIEDTKSTDLEVGIFFHQLNDYLLHEKKTRAAILMTQLNAYKKSTLEEIYLTVTELGS